MIEAKNKNTVRSIVKRIVAMILVVCMILTSTDFSALWGGPAFAYAETGVATASNATAPTTELGGEEVQTQTLPLQPSTEEGELENNMAMATMLSMSLMAIPNVTFHTRPVAGQLVESGNFLVQETTDGAVIWGFKDGVTDTTVTIPDTITVNGHTLNVVEIGEDSFAHVNLTALTLGSNVKLIGDNAFSGNQISSLTLPNSVEEIGTDAFRDNALTTLDLNQVKDVGERAFADNDLTSLNLGSAIEGIYADAFRNNNLTSVDFPNTLQVVEPGAFGYNHRYVRVTTTVNPLPVGVPQKDVVGGGYGYVMNPIRLTVVHKDSTTGEKIAPDIVIEPDLTNNGDIYVRDMLQTYTGQAIPNYTPDATANPNGEVTFTPDSDDYTIEVKYTKLPESIFLTRNTAVQPNIAPFTTTPTDDDVKATLLSFIKATDANNADLSSSVEFADPSVIATIKTAAAGTTIPVEYILRNPTTGEEKRLKVDVLMGTNMKDFPLGNGWVLGDFVYGGDPGVGGGRGVVQGLSPQGVAKYNSGNHDLILPHINPTTGDTITEIGAGVVPSGSLAFKKLTQDFTVTDYAGNIESIAGDAFNDGNGNNGVTKVSLPNVKTVGRTAFFRARKLREFDFSNVETIRGQGFYETGLTSVNAPNLTTLENAAFSLSKVGSDPSYPQGFYFPKLTTIPPSTFQNAKLTYVKVSEQMPLVTTIESNAFLQNEIRSVDITGVTAIRSSAFSNQSTTNGGLTTLVAPDLQDIGRAAFEGNRIVNLDLPSATIVRGTAFYNSGTIETLNAPNLQVLESGYNFYNNKLQELNLPSLIRAEGIRDFGMNYIKEVHFDVAQSLGTDIFYTPEWPRTITSSTARNPGLSAYGGNIVVHTNGTTGLSSKENYIVDPVEDVSGDFDENDFTWDAADPSRVTGLTSRGKMKLLNNGRNLVIPNRAKKVGANAFNNENISSVRADAVVEIEREGFNSNPLSSVIMPALTTIGDRAFSNNISNAGATKLQNFDFSHVTSIGRMAFYSAGLSGNLNLPLLTSVPESAFTNNTITSVNAPNLTSIGQNGFLNNSLSSVDSSQFPALTTIAGGAFQNNPVKRLDIPGLTQMQGSNEFVFSDLRNTIEWVIPSGTTVRGGNTALSNSTFNAYTPSGQGTYPRPGALVFTNPVNADGTLNRSNPKGYTETINRIGNAKVRKAVINPGTIKVNYRIEGTNESFDGTSGKPSVPDYREYIYEEMEPRDAAGNFATSRKYSAKLIPGYALVSSTDTTGSNVAGRSDINVPFEPDGSRTDREITFIYKKLEMNVDPSLKLDFDLQKNSSSPKKKEETYQASGNLLPIIPTVFSLNKIGSNNIPLQNAKLIITFDSPYIDATKTVVANDAATATLYNPSGVRLLPNGVEISLKNATTLSAVNDVPINFYYKTGEVPDGAQAHFNIVLQNTINGELKTVAQGTTLTTTARIEKPKIRLYAEPLSPDYNYTNRGMDIDGPRHFGTVSLSSSGVKYVSDPTVVSYRYFMSPVSQPIKSYSLKQEVPTYTAYDPATNTTSTKRAVFDPALNPGWELQSDGVTLVYTKELNQTTARSLNFNEMPSLKFTFPNIQTDKPVYGKVDLSVTDQDDPINPDTPTMQYAASDDITIYPIGSFRTWTGREYIYEKLAAGSPRLIGNLTTIYDTPDDRTKDVSYETYFAATNQTMDDKNVSMIDYDLDERLYYKRIEFTQSATAAGNRHARITAYKKLGSIVNPTSDRVILDQEVPISTGTGVDIPRNDVDYIKISIVETDTAPLDTTIVAKVWAGVKDPSTKLLSGGRPDYLKNHAYFIANTYAKGTDRLTRAKVTDPEFAGFDANLVGKEDASVYIQPFLSKISLVKGLQDRTVPLSYESYPDYSSGDTALGGQTGYYHISLQSEVGGVYNTPLTDVLKNFEIYDVLPDGLELNESDIQLDPQFVRAGGHMEVIGRYQTIEDGTAVTRRAIRFYADRLDLKQYTNYYYPVAHIKSKVLGDSLAEKLVNRAYMHWDPQENVELNGNVRRTKPNGQTDTQDWGYAEVPIKVKKASALSGKLEIRRRTDYMWTNSIFTESEEPFDYRMTVSQLDRNSGSGNYGGVELVNIFPGQNDVQQSKSGPRNSDFSNTFDTSRLSDIRVYTTDANGVETTLDPSKYTLSYLNTNSGADTLLIGDTVDTLADNLSRWSSTPASNTKAMKVKLDRNFILPYGKKLQIEVPMKAPRLSGVNDTLVDKKAVDSFSLRYYATGATTPEHFREVNNVQNIMAIQKGTLHFKKYGRVGKTTPDNQAQPLEGATFEVRDMTSNALYYATSDSNGVVTVKDLDVRHSVVIREVTAPDGYMRSGNTILVNLTQYLKADNNFEDTLPDSMTLRPFMNTKPVEGSLKIVKRTVDPSVNLPFVSFNIKGTTGGAYSNTDVNMNVSTGTDGTVTVNHLPEGNYSVKEIASSANLRFTDVSTKNVTVDASNTSLSVEFTNEKMQVPFRKVITKNANDLDPSQWDKLTDFQKEKISGYRFKVTDESGHFVYTGNTDANGEVILGNLKPNVVYTVTEEATQASPQVNLYQHNTNSYKFKLSPTGKLLNPDNGNVFMQSALNFPNMPKNIKGKIVVNKTDDQARALVGAKFELFKVTYAADGSVASITSTGQVSTTLQNGARAQAVFDQLEPGSYQVKEVAAPGGFYLSTTPIAFNVTIPSTAPANASTDARYNLSGNDIVYTHTQDVSNKSVKVDAIKGEDLEGYINVPTAQAQSYVNAHTGYKLRSTGDGLATVYKPLAGVVFELYETNNGVKVGSAIPINGNTDIVSDASGKLNLNYPFDQDKEYSIFEKTALSGYERMLSQKTFRIATEATRPGFDGTISIYMNNKKYVGSILVSKYDSLTRRPLGGAKFRLYSGHGAIAADSSGYIKEVESGADGFAFFGNLPLGDYTVREITAPTGYREPLVTARDKQFSITQQNLNLSYIVYNTKVKDIKVTKTWTGGSEASVQVRLMHKASNETSFTPVTGNVLIGTTPATTAADGSVTLQTAADGSVPELTFKDVPLANDSGREYTYEVQEVSVTAADGTVTSVVNSQIGNDYNVLIGGDITNGFHIQNVAKDDSKKSVMVSKKWQWADGSTTPLLNSRVVVALMQKVGSNAPTEIRRQNLDASNNWTANFTGLESRIGGQVVNYSVVELSDTTGFHSSVVEDVAQRTANSNVFKITNEAIKRQEIRFTKNWVGVDPSRAPSVVLKLYDSQNMTTPLFTQPVTLQSDGSYQAIFTNVPSYAYSVETNPLLAATDPQSAKVVARKIQYVVREEFADGQTRAGYTNTTTLDDAAFANYSTNANIANNLSFDVNNTMEQKSITVKKKWTGVDISQAPNVEVELMDETPGYTPVSVGRQTLSYNTTDPSSSFTYTYVNLPKYKPDGITEITYTVKENTTLDGYDVNVGTMEQDASNATHFSVEITNARKTKNIDIKKQWDQPEESFSGSNANTPAVRVDIYADTTNDGVVNPTPYTQTGVQTSGIVLDGTNQYRTIINGLSEYTADGQTKIQYYAKEVPVQGYTAPVNTSVASGTDGQGLIALSDVSGVLSGTFINKRERIDLDATVIWNGMNLYTPAERTNLPVPHVDVYDMTDPTNPKLVRENVPMTLQEDLTHTDRSRWTASMSDLPKYTADGQTAIVYNVVQRERYNGYTTTENTDPQDRSGTVLNIRDASGNVITNRAQTTPALATVTHWHADIVNTPKTRDITVNKHWEGTPGNSAQVYLTREGVRINGDATQPGSTPQAVTLNAANHWTHTFSGMPVSKIDGSGDYTYNIEEENIVNYEQSIRSSFVANTNSALPSNIVFDVTNTFKTIDITVKKNWVGVAESDAPAVTLQLMDVTNPTAPVAVSGVTATLNSANHFTAVLNDLPKFKSDGTTRIQYAVQEPSMPGYQFSTSTTYSDAAQTDAPFGTAVIHATNTRLKQEVKVTKNWVGVDPANAPSVVVELMDVTNAASPISLGTKTLSYSANPSDSFSAVFDNLDKYKADGVTEVKYAVRENTNLPEYDTQIGVVNTVDATHKEATITNTYKTVDVHVDKTWTDVALTDAPEVTLQLVDVTDPNAPVDVVGKSLTLNNANHFAGDFSDLPKYKLVAGAAVEIQYSVKETPQLAGYQFSVNTVNSASPTATAPYGSVTVTANNSRVKQEVKVTKNWTGVNPTSAPSVVVELMDVTDTTNPISLGTKTLSYNVNPALSFTDTFSNLDKYKADGVTEVQYAVKENNQTDGYQTSISAVRTDDATHKSVEITNVRVLKQIAIAKTWDMAPEIYAGSSANTPPVTVDILADTTDDGVVNPTPYTQTGIQTSGIVLNRANQYHMTLTGLNAYTDDGVTKIKYYVREHALQGYTGPTDPTATSIADGTGRLMLIEDAQGVLAGDIVNTQDVIDLDVVLNWHDLDIYPTSELTNLLVPTVDVYDRTDPTNPKLVRANTPMQLVEDTTVPGRVRWTADMTRLPKYTADGTKAIIYDVVQHSPINGYTTTQKTDPFNGTTPISIRNANGEVIDDPTQTTPLLSNVTIWHGVIDETPKTREVSVTKTWQGAIQSQANVYLTRNGSRINADPAQANHPAVPETLSATNGWAHTFVRLPVTSIDGTTDYNYDVEEVAIPGYTPQVTRTTSPSGIAGVDNLRFAIHNTQQSVDVTVQKNWSGVNVNDAPSVQMQLIDNTDPTNPITLTGLVATLDRTNNFTAEFNDLPKFKADGTTRIEYSVVEVNTMPGYTFSVATTNSDAPTVTSPDGTVSIVATNTRVTQEVKVNKQWVGVADSTAPSVNVELLDVTNPTSPISLGTKLLSYNANTAQNFTDVFTNLPKYKDDGVTEIHYEVKEVSPLPEYEVNVSAVTDVDASHKTATITNTYKTVDIHLTKSWVGVNAADAPAVTMQLVDATDANHKVDVAGKTVTLDANNGFAADLTDLPKYKSDGTTRILYEAREVNALPGYTFAMQSTFDDTPVLPDAPFGTVNIAATNTRRKQEVAVQKNWTGVDTSEAPSIEVELLDITDAAHPISLGTKTLSYNTNPAQNFKDVFTNLEKYKADGVTEVQYALRENTQLDGYASNSSSVMTIDDEHKSASIDNVRKTKNIRIAKIWNMAPEIYSGSANNTPPVVVDILADTNNSGNPMPYTQAGVNTTGIVLSAANSYNLTISGLNEYASDGHTKIVYYARERLMQGYTALNLGQILLTEDTSNQYAGDVVNTQDEINLNVVLNWHGLDRYPASDLSNLPVPHVDVYDRTDPANPKLVRENTPMRLEEDPTVPGRARWVANMDHLPKYTSDGTKAIIYDVVQRENYPGYHTEQITNPTDGSGNIISIRDGAGNVITDPTVTTPRLSNVTTWKAVIDETPRLRDMKVVKSWEGSIEQSVQVYLTRNHTRISADPTQASITPVEISEHTPGQSDDWSYVFRDLPYWMIDGQTVADYGIEEVQIPGYVQTLQVVEDGQNLLAKLHNKRSIIDITAKKKWNDHSDALSLRPNSVDFTLTRTTQNNPLPELVQTQTLSGTGDEWSYTFSQLPEFDHNGDRYIYKVEEVVVPQLNNYQAHNENDTTITNDVVTRSIPIRTVWVDNDNEHKLRPSGNKIELIHTLPNGSKEVVKVVENPPGTSGNTWNNVVENMPKYDRDGNPYTYSIRQYDENGLRNYDTTYSNDGDTLVVTNVFRTISVQGQKIWNELGNGARPTSVAVDLYRSDDPSHVYRSTNISAENASSATIWGYQFDNLPQYDQNAVPFEYSVKEHSAPKYYESSVVGMDITNTYHPEPVDFNFALKKLILARRIGLDTFHFVMQGVDGAPMPNGAINGEIRLSGINGVHNFGDVTYSHVGQYVYRFYEEAGTNQKFTYDTSILTMIVNVTDVDGKLQTGYRVTREKDGQVIDEGGKLEIKNIYHYDGDSDEIGGGSGGSGNSGSSSGGSSTTKLIERENNQTSNQVAKDKSNPEEKVTLEESKDHQKDPDQPNRGEDKSTSSKTSSNTSASSDQVAKKKKKKFGIPKTSDAFNFIPWAIFIVIGLVLLVIVLIKNRKNKEKK